MPAKPAFTAKVKIQRAKLPSAPINIRLSAAPEGATDVPTSSGGSTLKSDSRAAFGPATKPIRNPKWAARSAFKMPSASAATASDEYGR